MCGRYAINQTGQRLAATYGVDWLGDPPPLPRYNVAPQTDAPVLRTRSDGSRVLESLRWGLVPFWAADPAIGRKTINARSESAATTPAFREALQRRRCIVPASGFYEWKAVDRRRLPYWIHPASGLLSIAGVWESWRASPDAPPLRTFAVLTTTATADLASLHDRMPLLIAPEDRDTWLSSDTPREVYRALMRSAPSGTLRSHPVSPAVNHAGAEGRGLVEPVAEEEPPLLLL